MQQLSGLDALFVHAERANSYMHIGPVMIYDPGTAEGGAVAYRDIVATFADRLHLSSIFRRKLVEVPFNLDRPYWIEDPDFKLDHHIHHHTLAAPGGLQQLCDKIADLHARPLNRNHPLWEAHVIDGLDRLEGLPRGCFAIYLKTHHATQDGATGVAIVEAIHDLQPGTVSAADDDWRAEAVPGNFKLLRRALVNSLRQPAMLVRVGGRVVPALRHLRAASNSAESPDLLLPEKTRFNGPISARRVVGCITVELGQLKRISKLVPGATINDVSLAIVSGAMRKYLQSKGELPQDTLVAGAPVNARRSAQQDTGGNVVSVMRVSLCTQLEEPLERLRGIHRSSKNAKKSQGAIGADLMTDLVASLPGYLLAWGSAAALATGVMGKMNPVMHTLVTNVPGPRAPLYLCNARMRMIVGLGPCLDGIGLFHTISSYCDVVAVGFQACSEMLPDPALYTQCLQQSFDELRAARLPRKKTQRGRNSS